MAASKQIEFDAIQHMHEFSAEMLLEDLQVQSPFLRIHMAC